MKKDLTDDDILNAMLNTYYRRLYNKYNGKTTERNRG